MSRTTRTPRPRFLVTLEAPPTPGDPDGTRRLRRWLKQSWRGYTLRCVSIAPIGGKPGTDQTHKVIPSTNPTNPLD